MVSHDELVISIVLLLAWGFGIAALVLDWYLRAKLRRRWHADHTRRSLMMVLDEAILMEQALCWWVVFVLWATRPDYERWEARQDLQEVG
jgi:hypothetical protein